MKCVMYVGGRVDVRFDPKEAIHGPRGPERRGDYGGFGAGAGSDFVFEAPDEVERVHGRSSVQVEAGDCIP